MSHIQEQKNIAKNTFLLYLRMFLVMFVSLYTSRVVLEQLGIDDFGIYNIVGSIVVSFVFVQNSLTASTQRFMSYSHGEGNDNCSDIFSMSMNIHIIFTFVTVVILETFGLWFFNNIINIPLERLSAARIVYHLSVTTFCLNYLRIPFSALIVSREKFSIYAISSILDVLLKLVIVFCLSTFYNIDKLILYAVLILLVTVIGNIYVMVYCYIYLKEDSRYFFRKDVNLFRKMTSFMSWNLVGGVTSVASTEGPNYFMNHYLGVTVNAGMGIAKQVSNAIYSFSANFQTAFNPQIVKAYASNDITYLNNLIFRTSKLSFLLIFIIATPFALCCKTILNIWLTQVPPYAYSFCLCMLAAQSISALSAPLWMTAHAVGNIKRYQIVLSVYNLLILPISWFVMKNNIEPYWIIIFQVLINFTILIYRLLYLKNKINLPLKNYFDRVILRTFVLIPIISIPPLFYISKIYSGLYGVFFTSLSSVLIIGASFIFLSLDKKERNTVFQSIQEKFIKR